MARNEHPPCAVELRERMAELGADVEVSTYAPVAVTPYTTEPFVCPHGIKYWLEPSGKQFARWAEDGTP